ncbi:MAG: hypothetical protein KDJ15_03565 [Alphaproteobacteria bacterium]|nr:hypothetical protein [Alphaproteobacteria bacterium]
MTIIETAGRIILPLPPQDAVRHPFEMEIYARFMGHIRHVPTSRLETKILSAIRFTADMTEENAALIAKTLVDLGLRAPRAAFPGSFLEFADRSLQRTAWSCEGPSRAVSALSEHWAAHGEACFFTPGRFAVSRLLPAESVDG